MKKILSFTLCLLFSQLVFAGYVFNFSSGKAGEWRAAANWSDGNVPVGSVDSVIIAAPDNSGDWTSLMDLENITCQYLRVGKGCKLILDESIIFQIASKIVIDSGAYFTIRGELKLSCPFTVDSKGTFDVKGSAYLDENTGGCPETSSTFTSKFLYVDGLLELSRTIVSSDGLFWNKGKVKINLDSELILNMAINDGSIEGVYEMRAKNLINSGEINIALSSIYRTGFSILNKLINYNDISVECFTYMKGQISNSGILNASLGQVVIDTAVIINSGQLGFLETQNYSSIVAEITNKGYFAYLSANDLQDLTLGMSLINSGDFYIQSGSINLLSGSLINSDRITFDASRDSTRIKIPFINKGIVTSYGPISLGDAFINSGELEIN